MDSASNFDKRSIGSITAERFYSANRLARDSSGSHDPYHTIDTPSYGKSVFKKERVNPMDMRPAGVATYVQPTQTPNRYLNKFASASQIDFNGTTHSIRSSKGKPVMLNGNFGSRVMSNFHNDSQDILSPGLT